MNAERKKRLIRTILWLGAGAVFGLILSRCDDVLADIPKPRNDCVKLELRSADGTRGDVNNDGRINSTDALIILSCEVGIDTRRFCPMNCGDVDGDYRVTADDAWHVLRYDVGFDVPYPIGEPGCTRGVKPCPGCLP